MTVGRDCVRNVLDTNNIVCIRFTTVQCLIVINVPLKVPKVPLFNPLFKLISINKIFTVNSNSLINIVVIITLIVIIIIIGMNIIISTCVKYSY